MNTMIAILAITIGGIAGLFAAHYLAMLIRFVMRESDRKKVKAAMLRESYINQLYEENLLEDINRAAHKASKKMNRLRA